MGCFIRAENNVLILEEGRAKQVTQSMVFLVECEDCRVGLTGVCFHGYLCLAFAEEEELESTCLMRELEG